MTSPEEFLSFREEIIAESVELIEVNGINGINSIGEGPKFNSNWYAPGTDLSDDEPDQILATKTAAYKVFAQLGNGDLIAEIKETIQLADGEIFTEGFLELGVASSGETSTLRITGGTGSFKDISGIEKVTGLGSSMPGVFDVSLVSLKEIKGTPNSDVIKGENTSELIAGNNGNDTIKGGQGNDIIIGERGGDIIRGGAGDDTLAADRIDRFDDLYSDKSELRGNKGNDVIFGGRKDDFINGGTGEDLLFGKDGDDIIRGSKGFDLLNGGLGNDTLKGQDDIDVAAYSDLTFKRVFASVAGVDVNLQQSKVEHSSDNNALTWTDTLVAVENVIGTERNDRFIGDEKNNVFYGIEEVGRNDYQTEFISLSGESYQVTGDVVEYDGNLSEFALGVSELPFIGLTVTGTEIGTDTLIGIEFLKFDDGLVATDSIEF